ncbi:hypothetical protein ACIQ6K_38665 [Streptomyces sp. NPDC096354]|uniref:hypothetical protein n=1 Tax=Streptomyces sp. NPDC096354 TaxID=3366088 RepID=UPI0037F4A046
MGPHRARAASGPLRPARRLSRASATITHGSADTVRGGILSHNPSFLFDALGTFTSDTITLHIRGVEEGQTTKPVLLTGGPDMAGDGYRHLLMPVRIDLTR